MIPSTTSWKVLLGVSTYAQVTYRRVFDLVIEWYQGDDDGLSEDGEESVREHRT